MAVQVVAVGRVHVGAHPQAGVGDAHAAPGRPTRRSARAPARRARARAAAPGRAAGGSSSSPRRAATVRRARGRGCRRRSRSRPGQRRAEVLEERPRELASASRTGPWRSSSTSPSSTTRSTSATASSSTARSSGRRSRSEREMLPEVQVGDDQRAHRMGPAAAPSAAVRRRGSGAPPPAPSRDALAGADRFADLLGEHEADVLADDFEL